MSGWCYSLAEAAAMMGLSAPGIDGSCAGVSTDTRTLAAGQLFFAIRGENFDGNTFVPQAFEKGAAAAVCTVPVAGGPCLIAEDPLAALQRFAARHRQNYTGPLLAITGSCGKTTAKELTAALLATKYPTVKTKGNLNNEIGTPLSLLQIGGDTGFAVIEMGANHPGEIAKLCDFARPTESTVTMVAPAHLEGFGSIDDVAKAKSEIVGGLGVLGCFYVNADDPRCAAMAEMHSGETVCFGTDGKALLPLDVSLMGAHYEANGDLALDIGGVEPFRLPLPVRAHATNVLLAVAVGLRHGITDFEAPLRAACATAMRFRIETVGPFEVLDDTYNANPASMAAALEALAARPGTGPRIAALGGMLELGAEEERLHAELGERAAEVGVTHLFARGPSARAMISAAAANGVPHAEIIEDHAAIADTVCALGGGTLLLKGSRGMRMERILELLRARYPQRHAESP